MTAKKTAMKSPKQPMDRLKAEAGKAHAYRLTVTGRNGTAQVEILHPLDWPYTAPARVEAGDYTVVAEFMDEQNRAKFEAVQPTVRSLEEFLVALKDTLGADLGESQAS